MKYQDLFSLKNKKKKKKKEQKLECRLLPILLGTLRVNRHILHIMLKDAFSLDADSIIHNIHYTVLDLITTHTPISTLSRIS